VSEKSITRQRAGLVRRQKRTGGRPLSCWDLPWWQIRVQISVQIRANSLCPRQEKRTMPKPEIQIGNSGLIV
jgi:hypothetical protein